MPSDKNKRGEVRLRSSPRGEMPTMLRVGYVKRDTNWVNGRIMRRNAT